MLQAHRAAFQSPERLLLHTCNTAILYVSKISSALGCQLKEGGMGFFDDMVASLSRNIEMNEHFSVDAEYKYGNDGDYKCMAFITRICPSNKRHGKTIPYSFTMTCDEHNTTARVRAKLYHDRRRITPEDLIEIGNELNMQFPYCPFFFDTNEGRGVVATEIFSSEHYPDGPDFDDGQFFMLPDARNQLVQFYEKLLKTSEAYIRHDCV